MTLIIIVTIVFVLCCYCYWTSTRFWTIAENVYHFRENYIQWNNKDLSTERSPLREKCTSTEFFWSVYSCIQSEYRKVRTRKYFVFGQFSRSNHYRRVQQIQHLNRSKNAHDFHKCSIL